METLASGTTGILDERKRAFIGVLIGGFAGAAAILIIATRLVNKTRAGIQMKSLPWMDRPAGITPSPATRVPSRMIGRTAGNMTIRIE